MAAVARVCAIIAERRKGMAERQPCRWRMNMSMHAALASGRVAAITGAASGIGLAVAKRFATMGLRVCLADLLPGPLETARLEVAGLSPLGEQGVLAVPTDVSRLADVEKFRDAAYAVFGEVAVLMNNAGTAPGGGPWDHIDRWRRVLDVNLWGVINGVQSFTPRMLAQRRPCAIINTGSKQGITCPPGDTAYNVSKAGVKVLTEALAHSLRNEDGGQITAHLLIPGSTFTGMTSHGRTEKPPGAWTPDQVVDIMVDGINKGDFYILCPDNDVTREVDCRRILWAAQDITNNRPALSRWHPDYGEAFACFLAEQ
jgi:NAD(P)-dependent dehydrogenase (short-subunit alcohol dehydrogenase family)